MPEETGEKQGGGRWQPGQSGNPNGRPKGARNRASVLAAKLLDGDAAEIVSRAITGAKQGEPVALKLCIERLLPKSGARVEFELPAMEKAADIAAGLAAVIEAAAAGEITLDEAERFAWLLERQRAALETSDLAVRVEALEQDAAKEQARKKYGLVPAQERRRQ